MRLEDLTEQQREKISEFGVNTWYVLDLFRSYKEDHSSVPQQWRDFFREIDETDIDLPLGTKSQNTNGQITNGISEETPKRKIARSNGQQGGSASFASSAVQYPKLNEDENAEPIRGAGARIIENMNASLSIPTATTYRSIPVKLLEENRIIINQYLKQADRGKISFTHIIGWAIVKAIKEMPVMNNSFAVTDGSPVLVQKQHINLGLAVDIEKKDGSRSLIVPNIKKADTMNFAEYFAAYNDIINRSKKNKIEVSDFMGTSISLTNPGTIGTEASLPRLMLGQGAIIATGAIDYPPEYQAATKDVIISLGISKIMTISSTYDHRIIQGAESGMFLKVIHELLIGEHKFYDEIFKDLEIPVTPVYWKPDNNPEDFVGINNIEEIEKQAKAIQLINMFRVRGHLLAHLDPLKTTAHFHPELDSSTYGFTVWDYDREFITDGLAGMRSAKLRDILDILHTTYCNKIGVEFRHIQDPGEKDWLQKKMETVRNTPNYDKEVKKHILYKLIQAENFENFIDKKYLGHKRFSIEGSETVIAVLDFLCNLAVEDDVEELMMGMAHRGRLNVLANIIGKSLYTIFSEFEEIIDPNTTQGSGDVKYHLGASGEYKTWNGKKIKVSVASNPSHLEFVNPVVEGTVRAKQKRLNDTEKKKIIPVLLHGDAAFAGEGVVAETLNLSQLQGYSTGGTIHIIINNQIGFTTAPADARSTVYASDVAKMVQAPIFHVNGDDPEATLWVTQLAFEYRQKFKKDVVVDVFGYRRLGHNETDEPAYTQPLMYKTIKSHPTVVEIYRSKLLKEKAVTEDEVKQLDADVDAHMNKHYESAKAAKLQFEADIPLAVTKEELKAAKTEEETKVSIERLNEVVERITEMPEGFSLHPKLKKFIDTRREFLTKDIIIDWAFGEALAFGSLMQEGTSIRLSGQDSARGTFSQRHIVLTDVNTGAEIILHKNIAPEKAGIEALDSLLSESAVLGFEYGYSIADPITLVIWEAQFGDFANVAQPIIDNFIVSSKTKWGLPNNLVMLLPHAQEGQGPEHSSARLERYLELCAEDNMIVSYPTNSAQYFHLLRRQAKAKDRMPLIVMTPKSLLREKMASSVKEDFTDGAFQEIIGDSEIKPGDAKRVIITSGKVYYDLYKHRKAQNIKDAAIIRLEQFYPYHHDEMKDELAQYKNAKSFVWVQEEPRNMGALAFISLRLPEDIPNGLPLKYVTRKESASPAPGSKKAYEESQKKIMEEAFSI